MKRNATPRRPRIQSYLSGALYARLQAYRKAQGLTETVIVEKAVRDYLDGVSDARLVLAQLDRLARAIGRLHRDVGLFLEVFGSWLRVWYASSPPIEASERATAWAASKGRLRGLLRSVRSRLGTYESFAATFAEEFAAEDLQAPERPEVEETAPNEAPQ